MTNLLSNYCIIFAQDNLEILEIKNKIEVHALRVTQFLEVHLLNSKYIYMSISLC